MRPVTRRARSSRTGEHLADAPTPVRRTSHVRPAPHRGSAEMGRPVRLGAGGGPATDRRPDPRASRRVRARALLEQGKPFTAEAIPDIDETAENFRLAAEDVKRMETAIIPSRDVNKRILTFRKPNGVYASITPWNFPTLIPVELIAPGIAAGNTMVCKPSEWTPIAMANFMQIMADAGLPEGVVNVVYGDGGVGERLIQDENVDCVGFIGSHTTAEKIVRAAGLKRSLIEASGNGPVVVCADADLEAAAKGAVFGGFFCAGQVCCANVSSSTRGARRLPRSRGRPKAGARRPLRRRHLVGPMNNEPTAKMDAHLEDAVAKVPGRARRSRTAADRPTLPADRGRRRRRRHVDQPRRDLRADRPVPRSPTTTRPSRSPTTPSRAAGRGVHPQPQACLPLPRQPPGGKRRRQRLDRLLGGPRPAAPPVYELGGVGSEVVTRCST